MENEYSINDISKETLTFLSFFDSNIIKKIPDNLFSKLCNLAADSKKDFYIDKNKKFKDQKISEECKDLLSLIYYDYIAEEDEKKEILEKWSMNEKN